MKASTDLLRAIGINLARNILEQDELSPEAKLWRCVILIAFEATFVVYFAFQLFFEWPPKSLFSDLGVALGTMLSSF